MDELVRNSIVKGLDSPMMNNKAADLALDTAIERDETVYLGTLTDIENDEMFMVGPEGNRDEVRRAAREHAEGGR